MSKDFDLLRFPSLWDLVYSQPDGSCEEDVPLAQRNNPTAFF